MQSQTHENNQLEKLKKNFEHSGNGMNVETKDCSKDTKNIIYTVVPEQLDNVVVDSNIILLQEPNMLRKLCEIGDANLGYKPSCNCK